MRKEGRDRRFGIPQRTLQWGGVGAAENDSHLSGNMKVSSLFRLIEEHEGFIVNELSSHTSSPPLVLDNRLISPPPEL